MKRSIKGSLFIGRVSIDTNGYPCIRFGIEDRELFDKGLEYVFSCMGSVDKKRTTKSSTRIVINSDF